MGKGADKMLNDALRPDCQNCAALCCVAYAFDASDQFAIDKPAGQPCTHLADDGLCRIHEIRVERGFPGCLTYSCHGAGQRVVQQMFDGRLWQDDDRLLSPMIEALRDLQRIHEAVAMLHAARDLDLPAVVHDRRAQLITDAMIDDWTPDRLRRFASGPWHSEVRHYLRSLKDQLPKK